MVEIVEVLLATRRGVILLRTILRFLRQKTLKDLETSDKLLTIENPKVYQWSETCNLPMVAFEIPIRKRIYLKLELQQLFVKVSYNGIPLKRVFWYKGCNIDDVEASNIEAIGDGNIKITCPCMNMYPIRIHKWEIVGEVVFDTKLGRFSRSIKLYADFDQKDSKKLHGYLVEFQDKMQEGVEV
jgi:hypothetical protein